MITNAKGEKRKYMICVDVGVTAGLAIFDWDELKEGDCFKSILHQSNVGLSSKQNTLPYEARMLLTAKRIEMRIAKWASQYEYAGFRRSLVPCFLELPKAYHSLGGQTVIDSGALVKLSMCAGAIANQLHNTSYFYTSIHYVEVGDWKGQMKKEAMARRIYKILGLTSIQEQSKIDEHALDAVGIGLYKGGLL